MHTEKPSSIVFKKTRNLLELTWVDGKKSQISGQSLRRYCACSTCRAKGQVGVDVITDSPLVTDVNLMGSSGLQLVFADGHDRGIYPWSYLLAIASERALDSL